jgi:hypothetical protein
MKCAVCSVIQLNLLEKHFKTNNEVPRIKDIPEACASFNGSNGMTIYVCANHITANINHLDDIVVKQKKMR